MSFDSKSDDQETYLIKNFRLESLKFRPEFKINKKAKLFFQRFYLEI